MSRPQRTALLDLFEGLERPPPPDGDNLFSAAKVPSAGLHRVAKDSEGRPLLLLKIAPAATSVALHPVRLENLSLQYDVECRISRPDGTEEKGSFAVLRCLSEKVGLHEHFLRVGGTLLRAIGQAPDKGQVQRNISSLVDLFSAIGAEPRTSVQGLWAELFLIANSTDVRRCLEAWHAEPGERFDLADGSQRVEIKSYAGPVRRHTFSHEQAHPPDGTDAMIASVQVVSATGGEAIADLLDVIRERAALSSEELLQLEQAVARDLGRDHEHGMYRGFDQERGRESCQFYSTDDIPRLDRELPPGVSSVRFRSDLSRVASVSLDVPTGLFGAVAPVT